jgi:phage recombination protein Bet
MNAVVQTIEKKSLVTRFADQYGVDASKLMDTLKSTCFKQSNGNAVSNEQMMALLVVAEQYKLNPFTKEIYAFPDKGGIVPVVGVDGWSRIINAHDQFDGMEFEQDDEKCTCIMFRKDRNHPTKVTEYFTECKRDVQPWRSHPKRMLRHKAMIQCARVAFGFVGIHDQDEAERIVENSAPMVPASVVDLNAEIQARKQPASIDDAVILNDGREPSETDE